jgi:hypothetical protein
VRIEHWVTPWPGDPVMKPRFGHSPDDPDVAPHGARRIPPGTDHNHVLAEVVRRVIREINK